MARYSSTGRWSRPATGAQIRALKSHGGYDEKYYSMGRASQAISRGLRVSTASPARPRSSNAREFPRGGAATDVAAFELLSDLLGVPHNGTDIFDEALRRASPGDKEQVTSAPVASVEFEVSTREADGGQPTVVFHATVTRDSAHAGEALVTLQFESNVTFSETPPASQPFESGVSFDG